MKRIVKVFVAICAACALGFVIYAKLVPFIYSVKEPSFLLPVAFLKEIETVEDIPVRNDEYGEGEFGARRRNNRMHKGIDLDAELKSPVCASKSGWARSFYIPAGYGNLVVIDHPGGWQTRYGHLYETKIKKSRWVRQGEVIGSVGKTGNADVKGIRPHLHFEIRYKDTPVDPARELVKKQPPVNRGG